MFFNVPAGSGAYTWNQVGHPFTTVPTSRELRICMNSMSAVSPDGCIRSMAGSPTTAVPAYALQQGDEICWMYTCVGLGEDIGGGYAAGG